LFLRDKLKTLAAIGASVFFGTNAMRGLLSVLLLILSNLFMTLAWYGHLRWNYLVGFFFMVLAVYFVFRGGKWGLQ
jgi:uncharacterized protein (DUF486 family)